MQVSYYTEFATGSFVLPDAMARIKQMLEDGQSSAEDIAAVVSMDPDLSAKLLKLANSALYQFPSPVNSIPRAVSLIGSRALYNLMVAQTACSAFRHFENNAINLERFWQQSVFAGLIAKHLAEFLGHRDAERFFLLGLLHDFAEVVVAYASPEKARASESYQQTLPWDKQRQVLGFTYAECTADILSHWHLPTSMITTIAAQHDTVGAKSSDEVGILYLAVRIALLLLDEAEFDYAELVKESVLKPHGLTETQVLQAKEFAQLEAFNLLALMNPDLFMLY